MAAVPYPTFRNAPTSTPECRSLPAVGRVRIHPLTCPGSIITTPTKTNEQNVAAAFDISSTSDAHDKAVTYEQVLQRCIQQSQIPTPPIDTSKESAKERKKLMKQSVALASSYLSIGLGLDVSMVDVEMVISVKDVMDSDGCVACGFLDAGCAFIVLEVDEKNKDNGGLEKVLEAIEIMRLPRERIVLHFLSMGDLEPLLQNDSKEGKEISSKAGTISVFCSSAPESCKDIIIKMKNCWSDEKVRLVVQLANYSSDEKNTSSNREKKSTPQELSETVSKLSKSMGEDNGSISLVDPTAEELGLCYAACIQTDREDGLFTTVVCSRGNEALGLVYSSKESVVAALQSGRGVYYSRSRSSLWRKGDTSGRHQTLHRLDLDCDGDALRFTVTQNGADIPAFCHLDYYTCWGAPRGLRHLEDTLRQRLEDAPAGSYTKRLFEDETLLRDKLVEEAQELSEAEGRGHVAEELADVLYFAMVRAAKAGVSLDDAVVELDKRARKVTRRKGDSKAFRIQAGEAILGKSGDEGDAES
mmetsp:Transcript_15200/g.31864  ORF Transcript_15200/g.31864 Transcript_15200/m.31864 type:complete len:529 (+) Transcript_15200:69-1655(+)